MTPKTPDPSPLFPLPEDFLDDLKLFVCTRLDRLEPGRESAEYANLDQTAQRLIGQVEAVLPEIAAALLGELCECYTAMAALATEMYYRLGFADGVRMIAAVQGDGISHELRVAGHESRNKG